ncbi:MAG: mechanosensitive ion channel [Sedimentisphaerales bacterium]|nr:mechanosensitive ion channel [Sedimentisphaerales bacterium]
MEELFNKLQAWITEYGMDVISAIAILIVGRIVAGIARGLLKKLLVRSRVDETLVTFVTKVVYVALMVFIIIAAVGKLGVQTTSFVAVIGAAGLAVGLALQGSLSNFAAGVLLIIFKPFKVGDFIEAGGATGVVEEIGIFTTEMKSPDNKKIIVPNAKLMGDNITNYTAKEQRRIDIVAGVSYSADLDKVRKVLQGICSEDERILAEPAPTIGVLELADSSVNFVVRPWVKTADYWDVYFATQEKIKKRFDAEGIGIPFPQRDVHMYQEV